MLRWLCNPSTHTKERTLAFTFLDTHAEHIKFTRGDPEFDSSDSDSLRYWSSSGKPKDDFPHRSLSYADIVDPICDFILLEHEGYHDEQFQRARRGKPNVLVPIRICEREACGKFIMPERVDRRKYCSDICRASKDREGRPDFKRCYQCLWRLENELEQGKRAVVRKKLSRPTTQRNLRELEKRWPKHANRVKTLRQRARQ